MTKREPINFSIRERASYLILDFETRSEADLKKVGAWEYACHPTTEIICAAWRFGTREELRGQLKYKLPANLQLPNDSIKNIRLKEADFVVAHNALFEQLITKFRYTGWVPPPEKWICTASLASALALPRNLEGACLALNLPIKKDMEGRRLMLKYSKPRKPTKADPHSKWHNDPEELKRIYQYCQTDVDAETHLFLALPELNDTERKVWCLDQKINMRGVRVDRPLVKSAIKLIEHEKIAIDLDTSAITNNYLGSTTQVALTLGWLKDNGLHLSDLRVKTVSEALKTATGKIKQILEFRKAISKTSTAKYQAFEMRSRSDGRVRDNLIYHSASTGRWGGSGVQLQNLPRETIPDTVTASEIVREGDPDLVRLIYGNPMDVLSSCLRSVIIASEGKELFCADYAAIEARVLFWIAEHEEGIKAFREDRPIYEEMASHIYRRKITKEDKIERQVGKQAFLGCGYGMGHKKFKITCDNYGLTVNEEMAKTAVDTYRTIHAPVPQFWRRLEQDAILAMQDPESYYFINWDGSRITLRYDYEFLTIRLPSGRKLAYYQPGIQYEDTPWGYRRPKLYHWEMNSVTHKWERSSTYGGKLTENVVQAIARDLMAEAMLRIEDAGYEVILTIHDEILAEKKKSTDIPKAFCDLMAKCPPWAKGLPIKVEGWKGERYRK